jgi:hypothetical protein
MELLLFADDLILLIDNVDLQDKLEFLSKYCKIRNLEINIEKTKILIFQKIKTKNKCKEFKYGDRKFEIIKELYLLYLGLFSTSGLFSQTANYYVSKGKIALSIIRKLMVGAKMGDVDRRLKLSDTIVAATVLYACIFEKLSKVQRLRKSGRVVLHNSHVLFQRCIVARVSLKQYITENILAINPGTVPFIRDERAELIGKKLVVTCFFPS